MICLKFSVNFREYFSWHEISCCRVSLLIAGVLGCFSRHADEHRGRNESVALVLVTNKNQWFRITELSPHFTWSLNCWNMTCLYVFSFYLSRPYRCSSPPVSRLHLCFSLCLYFWVSASVSLTIWLRRSLSLSHPRIISLFIFLPLLLSIYIYIRLPVFLSVFLSFFLSVWESDWVMNWLINWSEGVRIPSLREAHDCVEVRVVE